MTAPALPHSAHCKRPSPVLRQSWDGSPELFCPGCGRTVAIPAGGNNTNGT